MSDQPAPAWTKHSPTNDAPQFPRLPGDPTWVPFDQRKRTQGAQTYVRFADLPEFESRRLWLYASIHAIQIDGRICLPWSTYLKLVDE